ncbi:MAG: hypothetical protein U0Q22_03305 [Acidimicrobiales bacterium]
MHDRRFLKGIEIGPTADVAAIDLAADAGLDALLTGRDRLGAEERARAADRGLLVLESPPVREPRRGPMRLGWATGDERDLPTVLRRHPRRARFPTGFGAPSVDHGGIDELLAAGWPRLDGITDDDRRCFARHTPPEGFDDPAVWAEATRNYQAMVVRFHVETLRRLTNRPATGFAVARLSSGPGPVDASVLHRDGRPKEAYEALRAACRPTLAVGDRLPPHLHGDERLGIARSVINDLAAPVRARLTTTLIWADDHHSSSASVTVGAGDVVDIEPFEFVVPAVSGPLTMELSLEADGEAPIVSRYRSDIYADPHDH